MGFPLSNPCAEKGSEKSKLLRIIFLKSANHLLLGFGAKKVLQQCRLAMCVCIFSLSIFWFGDTVVEDPGWRLGEKWVYILPI